MKFTFPPESRPLSGYTIKRAIDRGGFGEVYYALNDAGKEVALKLLQHNLDVELRGVRQCLNLRHPNLITIFDIRTDDDEDHWIVMEYAGGKTLEQTLASGPHQLAAADALVWLRGIAEGVEFLHARGLVHRDLKPGNIFNDQGTVKVGDVGLSKFITPSRRSAQTESVGTVHYMAPEVARGRYGKEVDVYAAGVILYEMLVGKVPFEGESTAEILMKHLTASPDLNPIPEGLRPLIARALEKDPERRLESISELANGLEKFLAGKQPFIPERKRETIQESINRVESAATQHQPDPSPRQPVMAAPSDSPSGDELDHFWRYVSLFFRPERLFFHRVGRTLYSQWKQDVPVWIRWPVSFFLVLLSPVWLSLLLVSTPTIFSIALIYYAVREVIRVAIWMANPPPGTHPWTRLFGGSPSVFPEETLTPEPAPFHPQQSPLDNQSVVRAQLDALFTQEQPSPVGPRSSESIQRHPEPRLSLKPLTFVDRWSGVPLFILAVFSAMFCVEGIHQDKFAPFLLLISAVIFALLKVTVSALLTHYNVPRRNRSGLNLILIGGAIFAAVLGVAVVEMRETYPRAQIRDEGWVAVVIAFLGACISSSLVRRRFLLTDRLQGLTGSLHPFDRWIGIPLLALAGVVLLLFSEAVREDEFIPLVLMGSLVAFGLMKFIMSFLFKQYAVPPYGRRSLNLVLISISIFSIILMTAGVELMDSYPRPRVDDEGWIAVFLALFGLAVSSFAVKRRFRLNESLPQSEVEYQPVEVSAPMQVPHSSGSLKLFGWGLAAIFLVLVTLSVSSILLATLAPHTGNVNINGVRIQTYSSRLTSLGVLLPVILAGGLYFLVQRSRIGRSPEVADGGTSSTEPATKSDPRRLKRRKSEFWLVVGFLALWFSLTLGWWKGIAPAAADGSWAAFFFYPDSWTGITAIAWGEIIFLALLIGQCVPKIPLQSEPDNDPRLAHLRLATGFFQSILWSFLLSAGFALTILALSETSSSGWNPGRPWDASSGSYPHAVWLFCFLAFSSTILLTQSYLRTRYGFLNSSSFFTLLISGLLIAGVSIGLDGTLGSIFPHRVNSFGEGWLGLYVSSLQFFLPTMICGGWLGQIDLARPRRFRLSRLIWVILVTAAVGGILGFDQQSDSLELWVFLMGGLSGVVQLGSLWADPYESVKRSASIQSDRHYYNVSLVQGA